MGGGTPSAVMLSHHHVCTAVCPLQIHTGLRHAANPLRGECPGNGIHIVSQLCTRGFLFREQVLSANCLPLILVMDESALKPGPAQSTPYGWAASMWTPSARQ